jgi:hypothetical protein
MAEVLQTQAAQAPTFTPQPTPTTAQTETATNLGAGGNIFALNYLGSQTSGGVTIEIARVLFGDKDVTNAAVGGVFDQFDNFQDKTVVVEIIFKVTNSGTQVASVYPDQGTVVVGSEQVSLFDYFMTESGESFSGDIFPNVTLIGGLYFGLKKSQVAEISQMTIAIDGPFDSNFNKLGQDFYFQIDLSNHVFQDLPDELK